jgi:Na+/melibiose symporter-like transporter
MVVASILALVPHVAYAAIPNCDECLEGVFMLVFLGMGYSIYASVIWASVPFVVDVKAIGTAYGVITAI